MTPPEGNTRMLKLTPLKIIAVFVALSVLWITSSDLLVSAIASSPKVYTLLSIIKGWLYIVVTAILLYGLIRRYASERDRAEAALKESEDLFRDMSDSLPQTVFEMDERGTFTYVNRTGLEMFGYSPEDFAAGLNVLDIMVPEDHQKALDAMAKRMRGEHRGYIEYTALRKDGSTFPMSVHSAPVTRNNRPTGLRGIAIDISEHKLLEDELLKTQKLESLGILAGGIAHDYNNILTAILGNIALTRKRCAADEQASRLLGEAEKASLHAKDLTKQLVTFSKGGKPIKRTTSLEPTIRDATGFALRGAAVKSRFHFEDSLWPVEADAGQLGQVFHNLIINACQAMPRGGLVTVEARNAEISPSDGLPIAQGRYVFVTVQDQGTGIAEEHLSKIFDPYFTTKRVGSGLGLAVTYSIITNHNGHIFVRSKPGEGTVFMIALPASGRPFAEERTAPDVSPSGSGRVLIMDDEDMVRNVAGGMARELGYEVEFARDGAEAVQKYQQAAEDGKPFDAVIMDLTIPGGM